MCRHAAYVGPPLGLAAFVSRSPHSLVEQAYRPREMITASLNADGYGLGWYLPDGTPGVYTNPMPIWSDTNLAHLGAALESTIWIGNVRSATPGQPVNQANTHPFLVDRLLFSHNGFVDAFADGPRARIRGYLEPKYESVIRGSTDSEYLFAALRQEMAAAADVPTAFRKLFAHLDSWLGGGHGLFNLMITDGRRVYATRHAVKHDAPSLYVGTDADLFPRGWLIASEPFTDAEGWRPVPDHHLITIEAGRRPQVTPL